jgi:tetratricopeptide (TPR) repeat protein
MSIARMRRRFSVTMNKILWIIIGVFIIGIPAYFGGFGRGGSRSNQSEQGNEPPKVIAVVNGDDLTRTAFDDAFVRQYQRLAMGRHLPLQQITDLRLQSYNWAVSQMLQFQEARRRKIEPGDKAVTDAVNERTRKDLELIRNQAAQANPPRKVTEVMRDIMRSYGKKVDRVTEAEFEQWYRDWLRQKDRLAGIKQEIILKDLEERVSGDVNPSYQDMVDFYQQDMDVQEIQFKPKSELDDPKAHTYAKDEIEKAAKEAAARARKGEDFTALVMEYSSDPLATQGFGNDPTKATKGKTGFQNIATYFRGRYGSAIAKEAPKYEIGKIVGPFWSKTFKCYFVFKVLEKHNDPPEWLKDESKRDEYLRNFRDQMRRRAYDDFKAELEEKAKITVKDHEVRGARLMQDRQYKQAIKEFDEARQYLIPWYATLPENVPLPLPALAPGAVCYSMGQMEQSQEHWEKAKDYYSSGLSVVKHDPEYLSDMYLGLAYNEWQWMTALEAGPEREQHKEATLRFLEVMVRMAPDYPAGRENAIWLYTALGRRDLIVEQRIWLADRYEQAGPDLDLSKALEHRDWLLKYYQETGEKEKAAEQETKIEALKKRIQEESGGAAGPGAGGISVTPAPAQ